MMFNTLGLEILIYAAILLVALMGAVYAVFLGSIYRALKRCAPFNRTMPPGQVWLCLIPLFNMVWPFVVVARVAESLRREFAARQAPAAPGEDFGKTLGTVMCALSLSAVIPYVGVLTGLAGFVCWIVYWARIAGYSRALDSVSLNLFGGSPNWAPPPPVPQLQPQAQAAAAGSGWPILLVLMLGYGATFLQRAAMSALSNDQRADLHWSYSQFGWIFWASSIGLLCGYVFMTMVTVFAGTRWGAFVSLAGAALAASGTGLARNLAGLIALRLLLGFFTAGLLPAAIQAVRECFPARVRPFAIGLFLASGQLVFAVASHHNFWSIRSIGWRAAFWLTGIPLAIAAALCIVVWPAGARREPSRGVSGTAIASTIMLGFGLLLTAPVTVLVSAWFASFANRTLGAGFGATGMASAVSPVAGACGAILAGAIAWAMMSAGMSAWRTRAVLLTVWLLPLVMFAGTISEWPYVLLLMAVCSVVYQGWSTVLYSAVADTLPAGGVAIGAAIGALMASVGGMLASQVWGRAAFQGDRPILPGVAAMSLVAVLAVAILAWLVHQDSEAAG